MEQSKAPRAQPDVVDQIADDQAQAERTYRRMRDIWNDYNSSQKFEHSLINRRTTWLLTSQTILFAAYGVTFGSEKAVDEADVFRIVVGCSGIAVAALVFVGVLSAIQAKHQSWKDYCDYYANRDPPELPEPLRATLDWGVRTRITKQALILDTMLPFVFIAAWVAVLSL